MADKKHDADDEEEPQLIIDKIPYDPAKGPRRRQLCQNIGFDHLEAYAPDIHRFQIREWTEDEKYVDGVQYDVLRDSEATFKTIEFRWNPNIRSKEECDVMHWYYLVWRALEKVSIRQTYKNEEYWRQSRENRILRAPNWYEIMDNFIRFYRENPDKNKFDGKCFQTVGKRNCINDWIAPASKLKLGWATKIHQKLAVEIKVRRFWARERIKCVIKTSEFTRIYLKLQMKHLNEQDFLRLFENALAVAPEHFKVFEENKETVVKYFADEMFDGWAFENTRKDEFADEMVKLLGDDARKSARELYVAISNSDLETLLL
jgi:hypothetical protein